jgi:hypothetical protein
MVFPFFFPAELILCNCGSGRGEEPERGKSPPPDSDPFSQRDFAKNLTGLSSTISASAHRQFEFHKRRQFFIRTHNETLTVAVMRVDNPDRSPVGINR